MHVESPALIETQTRLGLPQRLLLAACAAGAHGHAMILEKY